MKNKKLEIISKNRLEIQQKTYRKNHIVQIVNK